MTQNSWFVLIWIFNRRYQMMYILEFYQCLQINFFVKKGDVFVGSKVQKGEMKTCQWLLFSLLNVFSLQIPSTFNSQFQGKQVFCFPLLLLSKGKKKNLWFVYIGCWSQILVFNWPWKRVNSNVKFTENKDFDQQIQPIKRKTQFWK